MKNIITTHEATGELWNLVGQIAESKQYQRAKTDAQRQTHPSPEKLYEYLLDELAIEEARSIRTHLAYCSDCTDDMAVIMRIEDDEEHEEEYHAEPVKFSGELHHALLENVADEYWEPRYAGKKLSAHDMPKQEYVFQNGQITIKIDWKGTHDDKTAYIWIAWDVKIPAPFHLHIQFIKPETREILYAENLGQTEQNHRRFKEEVLGFDPTTTRFAVVAFTEKPL